MNQNFAKLTFTDSVKKIQEENGSRNHYSKAENSGDRFELTQNEISFINEQDSLYLSSVGENDWPYIQHRGGQKGFLKVINYSTLAMADFKGNAQYISTGNLTANNKSMLFIMDYANQSRLKIWVETQIIQIDENKELYEKVKDENYKAKIERIMLFNIKAYDWNCTQHITKRFTLEEIEVLMASQ